MAMLGAGEKPLLKLNSFRLQGNPLHMGDYLQFSFNLQSHAKKPQRLIVDYKIHYMKKSGELKPKVFKLKTLQLRPNESVLLTKKHLFQDFTTRKHYAGEHVVEIVVNGMSMMKNSFQLRV